jgi:hypothetical protein
MDRAGQAEAMSSGELHEGATHPPPTGRFGLQLTLDGDLGQPQRLSECELVPAWLDERSDALGLERLIEPCLIEGGARNDQDPSIARLRADRPEPSECACVPASPFVRTDIFTCGRALAAGARTPVQPDAIAAS